MIVMIIFLALAAAFYFYKYRNWDYKKKFTCKTVLIYLSLACTVFWVWFTVTTVVDVIETEQYHMLASRLERAEGNAWRGDYGWMADHMDLDKSYEEEFEYLWERLYMYTGSRRCMIFGAARDAGLGEVYDKKAAEWEEKLLKVCGDPKYEENIPYAKAFLEMNNFQVLQ